MAQSVSIPTPSPKTSPPYWNARRRVYAVWAVIVALGFVATQYYQNPNINGVWTGLSIIGLGYMLRVMKLKLRLMRNIFTVWVVTIVLGITVSGLAVHTATFAGLVPYLGVFWLVLLGLGHWANGIVDPPSGAYWASGALQIAAAIVCVTVAPLLAIQYIVAGAIGSLAMIWLILYANMSSKQSTDLYVKTMGIGEPIVLIHGGASSHHYWQKFASLLAPNYHVIMPDLLGMGASPKPTDCEYTLDDFVETIERAINESGVKGKYRVLAHSAGAIVGVALAHRAGNRVEKLVLSSPIFYTSRKAAKKLVGKAVAVPNVLLFGPLARASCEIFCRTKVLPRFIARLTFRSLPSSATNDVTSHTWQSYVGMRDNLIIDQHALADLASIKSKVEVVVGTQDRSMEPTAIEQIKAMPNVDLHQVPSGHNLPFSQTELLIQILSLK